MPKINKGYFSRLSGEELSERSQRRVLQKQIEANLAKNVPTDVEINNTRNVLKLNKYRNIESRGADNRESNSAPLLNFNTFLPNFRIQENSLNPIQDSIIVVNNEIEPQVPVSCKTSLRTELGEWAIACKIPHQHLNQLLSILRKYKIANEDILPKDARTLLCTSTKTENIRHINPNGKYFHFGLAKAIEMHYLNIKNINIPDEIKVVIGVDGLPLTRSSSSHFWPILAYFRSHLKHTQQVYIIGLYWGSKTKPTDSNEFLQDFVTETSNLLENGLTIGQKHISIRIDAFCCDAPAKSMLLKTKGHTGLFSCTKCTQEGEYAHIYHRTFFAHLDTMSSKRTHTSFAARTQEEYHISPNNNILLNIPNIDIIKVFPLDYMHLICLGVMRKLVLLWMNGPLAIRIPNAKVKQISLNLRNLKDFIPIEFCRKPRDIEEVCRWKATEFRQLLIYTGVLVFKNVLSDRCYRHFLCLNIAITILLSPNMEKYLDFANQLLNYFVSEFGNIYGHHLIFHNIHGLIHLCDDYKQFGALDNTSCFPFENFMKHLKSMIRKHDRPLEQVINRYKEIPLIIE